MILSLFLKDERQRGSKNSGRSSSNNPKRCATPPSHPKCSSSLLPTVACPFLEYLNSGLDGAFPYFVYRHSFLSPFFPQCSLQGNIHIIKQMRTLSLVHTHKKNAPPFHGAKSTFTRARDTVPAGREGMDHQPIESPDDFPEVAGKGKRLPSPRPTRSGVTWLPASVQ